MLLSRFRKTLVVTLLALGAVAPAQAGSDHLPAGSYLLAFSDQATGQMEKRLRDGARGCQKLPWIYRLDCLSETFRSASRLNSNKPDYRDARRILGTAAKKLDALVDQNTDKAAAPVKVGRKSYRPVVGSRRKPLEKAGRAIVAEAETLLLRSGGGQKHQAHYARLAAAVDATELLLRAGLRDGLRKLAAIGQAWAARPG